MNGQSDEMQWHDVTGYAFIKDYVLSVRFDDGTERIIDFEPILIGPFFGPLRDPRLFRQARVDADLGTLVWPTGADIEPSVLYDWRRHVDAIVQRRRQRWTMDYSAQSSHRQLDRALLRVAETNREPYEVDRLSDDADQTSPTDPN